MRRHPYRIAILTCALWLLALGFMSLWPGGAGAGGAGSAAAGEGEAPREHFALFAAPGPGFDVKGWLEAGVSRCRERGGHAQIGHGRLRINGRRTPVVAVRCLSAQPDAERTRPGGQGGPRRRT